MATFVLVHGAWHGSWCWKRVRAALQAAGHDVFTPTLTGLCERSHLLARDVSLETHIRDVENLIRWEELTDVVLCGHSYGGMVVTGVADRMPERIRSLVYLDAFLPEDGESLVDLLPEDQREQLYAGVRAYGDGWKAVPIPAEAFVVNSADCAWVNSQCTMQPLATLEEPVSLSGGIARIANVTYIHAEGFREGSPFPRFRDRARARGWNIVSIACGHDVMVDRPEVLTQILLEAAEAESSKV
jgi:pimeloyl-ACP methyl ester carboxylesterase